MPGIDIGTSGWSYKEWEGAFYPMEEKRKLAYYSRFFSTAEIDSSFYAYPGAATVASWLRNSPPGFTFCPKLPKLITHDKGLDLAKGVQLDLARYVSLVLPMHRAGKLGATLIQLPPSFTFDSLSTLRGFLAILPTEMSFAVEFRHRSWLRDESYGLLRSRNVANTIVDEPLLPPETVVTADFSFVRWHGQGKRPWYNYRYSQEELEPWKGRLMEVIDRTQRPSSGFFNNHFRANAVENALRMKKLMGTATPEVREAADIIAARLDHRLPPLGADADQATLN